MRRIDRIANDSQVPWIHYDMGILQDYHIQCKSVSHTLFHTQTCLKCDGGCAVFSSIVAIYWNLRLGFHLSCFYWTGYKSCAYSLVCPQIQKLQTVL